MECILSLSFSFVITHWIVSLTFIYHQNIVLKVQKIKQRLYENDDNEIDFEQNKIGKWYKLLWCVEETPFSNIYAFVIFDCFIRFILIR